MSASAIMTEIISILVSAITSLASGIGSGISDLVDAVFFTTTGTGADATTTLSTFGIMICIFAGISLAVGLSRLIVHWLSTLGGSRV